MHRGVQRSLERAVIVKLVSLDRRVMGEEREAAVAAFAAASVFVPGGAFVELAAGGALYLAVAAAGIALVGDASLRDASLGLLMRLVRAARPSQP